MLNSEGSALGSSEPYDLVVIGGGINGCAIARDASGRGLKVLLCEKGDLAEATSSAATKLFHGGLRYLEYFEFRLIREALIEREILLRNMPHISWPMRFVFPIDKDLKYEDDTSHLGKFLKIVMPFLRGRRPAWLIRVGLFIYDHLGGRKILPGTKSIDLKSHKAGRVLKSKFQRAFEYSDCWVNDSRLVILNARDAAERGAKIFTQTKCESAFRGNEYWHIKLMDQKTGIAREVLSKGIVNAGGPWVEEILTGRLQQDTKASVRLVRGSHIVLNKIFEHEQPYFLQLSDGRVIFAIPYETDYTLIGTTDHDYDGNAQDVVCTPEEQDYLLRAVGQFFKIPPTAGDVVWTYSGVRPLYDDNASDATAATRDYVLSVNDQDNDLPLLSVFGGKLTTHRKLAEDALAKLASFYPSMNGNWTADAALPGGDFPVDGVIDLRDSIMEKYSFLSEVWAIRLVKSYGLDVFKIYGSAKNYKDLGMDFGATLYKTEVDWLIQNEWAKSAKDIIWRRSKLGLRLSNEEIFQLDTYVSQTVENLASHEKVVNG